MKHEWHTIHDFFKGWGVREHIPDNFVVTEDHSEALIPWKVGHHKQEERVIWYGDARKHLGIDVFAADLDLEKIYEDLKAPLAKELEERRAHFKSHPIKFERITVPKFTKDVTELRLLCGDAQKLLRENAVE